ncbi:glycosyltransferase family 2 protein [Variovorax sp. 38R]|uniref:glycosyltransferase family 2 protein n=1 Tax=Variovorax sp. 38R TaxID=2774875 RepID=UPI00177B9208|nr:glycosyltransferase [Variovorax sp. 38R]QOF79651.1 glycosyltransferase family 2 protein [Variovorax sp. 38R]
MVQKIGFISVNYKNFEVTRDLCKSLESQSGLGELFEIECIIVDNSESEDQVKELSSFEFPRLNMRVIDAKRNVGYFGGLNLGLRETNSKYVVICNNDLKFHEEFCAILISQDYDPSVFSIAPDVVTVDGYRQNPHVLRPMNWFRRMQLDLYYSNYYIARFMLVLLAVLRPRRRRLPVLHEGQEIHMGIGACYVLMPGFLNKFNKLNFPNFLYGEEAYFSKQIHDAGGILWYEPKLNVIHAESLSTAKIPKRQTYEYAKEGYPEYRRML